jgi:hypothetical protein
MKACQPPIPPSHRVFPFQQITISSNFDSGNLLDAQSTANHAVNAATIQFNLWLCPDHPKNQYRTWFYFSISGVGKGVTATFNIKNMQNQVIDIRFSPECSAKAYCRSAGRLPHRNGSASTTRSTFQR